MNRYLVLTTIAVLLTLSYYLGGIVNSSTVYLSNDTIINTADPIVYKPYSSLSEIPNATSASILVPAIDDEEKGVATNLTVQVVPGTGKSLVNIDRLFFWVDTQSSIRTAKSVAGAVTGMDESNYDIVYTIKANASLIEGPSAGVALTAATIAALENRTINKTVMITGTISSDGTIGPVGGVMEKARAAREIGAELFIVPPNQGVEIRYENEEVCQQMGVTNICKTETVPNEYDVSEHAGIPVIEVSHITDAMQYLLS